jgi:uncharacterized membrane protein YkoI
MLKLRSSFALMLTLFLSLPFVAFANNDVRNGSISINNTTSKLEYLRLAKFSLEEAIREAISEVNGKAVEADLEEDDGFLVYQVKVMTPQNQLVELKIDAGNKKILARRSKTYAE